MNPLASLEPRVAGHVPADPEVDFDDQRTDRHGEVAGLGNLCLPGTTTYYCGNLTRICE
jgi:hypothetical protein